MPSGPGSRPPAQQWWAKKVLFAPMWAILAVGIVLIGVIGIVVATGGDDDKSVATERTDDTRPRRTVDTEASDTTTPETNPPKTDPPETNPPKTDPPETDPRETDPRETDPATTEPATTEVVTTEPAATGDEIAGAPAGAKGTHASPLAPGQVADLGDGWRVQILDVIADGAAQVAAENEFNDPPPAGKTFSLVTLAVGYFGLQDPTSPFSGLNISAVGAANVQLDNSCGSIPDDLYVFGDMFAGAVVTGNVCFVTTPDDAPALQVYAEPFASFSGDEVYLDASAAPTGAVAMTALQGVQAGAAASTPRTAPIAVGTPTDIGGGWQLTVSAGAHDITDAVSAENQFNDPPPDGQRYYGVDVTFNYNGVESTNVYSVTTKAVGNSNVALNSDCGVIPNGLDNSADILTGGTVAGTICFVGTEADAQSMVFYATGSFDVDYKYFAAH